MCQIQKSETLKSLQRDHGIIGRFLRHFRRICLELEQNEDFHGDVDRLVAFIDSFIEEFHHQREEQVLFAHVQRTHPGESHLGRRLFHDHEDGRHYIEAMRAASSFATRELKASFLWNAMGYSSLSHDHLSYEERELYPHIAGLISDDADQELLEQMNDLFPDTEARLEQASLFVESLSHLGA